MLILQLMNDKRITIIGPTASGKTSLAAAVAHAIGGEVISADSRQVYRRMDIGTGKDLCEYVVDGDRVPCHLIDIVEPGTRYNLFMYQHDFLKVYSELRSRGVQAVLCGGSGLYVESILRGYQLKPVPENPRLRSSLEHLSLEELTRMLERLKQQNGTVMHNTTDVDSVQRAIRAIEIESYNGAHAAEGARIPEIPAVVIGIDIDRETRRSRITHRLDARLEEGMVDEVRSLLDSGIPAEDLIYYGLEYRYVTEYVTGLLSHEEMHRQLETAIHQFAKRQMTWFRGMEKRGVRIHWVDGLLPLEEKVEAVLRLSSQSDGQSVTRAVH